MMTDCAEPFCLHVGIDKIAIGVVVVRVLEVAAEGSRIQEAFDQLC